MPVFEIVVDKSNNRSVDFSQTFYRTAESIQEAMNGINNIKMVKEIGMSYDEYKGEYKSQQPVA